MASLGDRRGSNPHLRVHSATCSTTTPRPPSLLRFPELGSNERLRFQRPPSCRLDDPGKRVGPVGVAPTAFRLSCGRSSKRELRPHPPRCSRLESNQHLLRFRQAPSPDRLREHLRGRGGARPRASSTIRFSEITLGRRRGCSGMRTRTSISGVKVRGPAFGRSPIGGGPGGNRTPFARVRAECFAIKASGPHPGDPAVPSAGLEPTQAGLKGRCPTAWASTANDSRQCVFVQTCGSGRTRTERDIAAKPRCHEVAVAATCAWAFAQTGLQPASFATRMHAPRSGSGDRSSRPCERTPEMKKAAVVSQGGFKRTNETFVL